MNKIMVSLAGLVLAAGIWLPANARAAGASAARHVYYGNISDSMCGAKHMMGNARQCTLSCVKGGAKYVFVTGGRVVKIANQNFASLPRFAGDHVKVIGTRHGGSITISQIAPVASRRRK